MAGSLFWLYDEAWLAIELHLPKNQPGARRFDDRRVISGIVQMLKCGGRWQDCPKRLWSLDHILQSLEQVEQARRVGPYPCRPD